uniref:Pectinesterase inhibitor domain-containing protein n=1 Tax=Kalanchoe fedtschenkoi TaxID=63787 RepID=A0A7N0TWY1_KALFE
MESVNIYKGYGKVVPLDMEDQHHQQQLPIHKQQPITIPNPRRSSTAAILAVSALSITLIAVITLAAVFGASSTHPRAAAPPDPIRLVCNVTRYPDSCFAAIAALDASPDPDPELLLRLSVRACSAQAAACRNVSGGGEAVQECLGLYDDAASRIGDAMEAMGGDGKVRLTEDRISDVQTWLSAALTDQETCLDGLEEMKESADLEEFKVNAGKFKEYVSNSLAIVANIHALLQQFGLQLH